MGIEQQSWDEVFRKAGTRYPDSDGWLMKHKGVLEASREAPILDVACGSGSDTVWLSERDCPTVSSDHSMVALRRLRHFIPDPMCVQMDLRDGLPFQSGSAQVVIASLCLHYFPLKNTQKMLAEFRRVLTDDGLLLCRVNSVRDVNYGAGQGDPVEPYLYAKEGRLKRFFDRQHLDEVFAGWQILSADEYEITRFGPVKVLWEIALCK